jgi:hypothetical protein
MEKKMITCQNPSCKKNFAAPLRAINLQQNAADPFYACPHCLTIIRTEQTSKPDKQVYEELFQKEKLEIEQIQNEETVNDKSNKLSVCEHYRGFLSERSSKEKFPDDCLVCKDIVECMSIKIRE